MLISLSCLVEGIGRLAFQPGMFSLKNALRIPKGSTSSTNEMRFHLYIDAASWDNFDSVLADEG